MTFLPIVARELRVAARKRSSFWLRVIVALAGVVIGSGCILMNKVNGVGTAEIGKVLFAILTWLSVAVALSAGLFLTSDCLSEEKREGSLGLLFLTDLRGYDVTTGKLLVTSLRGCYALLAVFPILAATLLMGGVTGLEFWKACLAILNALFCSLVAGLLISAVSRDAQKALAGAVLLLLGMTFAGPVLDLFIARLAKKGFHSIFSLSSPGFTFKSAGDWGRSPYWTSMWITQTIAWSMFTAASLLVPRTWQEKAGKAPAAARTFARAWKYGSGRRQKKLRRKLLDRDAVLWLACRERWQSAGVWAIAIFSAGGFGYLVAKSNRDAWIVWQYLAWFFLLFYYLWAASQSCRFFVEARRAGLIELLLATPITEKQIVRGQWRALLRMFGLPMLILLVICMVGTGLSQRSWQRMASTASAAMASAVPATNGLTSTSNAVLVNSGSFTISINSGTNTGFKPAKGAASAAAIKASPNVAIMIVAAAVYGITVAANFTALFWFGMWMGLTSKNANTATAKTFLFVHVIPWLVITFGSNMIIGLLMMWLSRSGSGPNFGFFTWYSLFGTLFGGALTLAKDVGFFLWARKKLYGSFREQASRSLGTPQLPSASTTPPVIPTPPAFR